MLPKLLVVLALGAAVAAAGCTSPPAQPAEGTDPTPTGGSSAAPGASPGNRTGGNSTSGNATVAPPPPAAPQVVHEADYQWTVLPPADGTFDLPRDATIALNVTQVGPGAGSLTVEVLDASESPVASASVTADPNGAGTDTGNGAAPRGTYTVRLGGNGVGTLHVQVIAT